ncbi:hypothetical protein B0T20DRAFT_452063 [Sordaria brevicollis]|uniref:Protein HRI1 n=1 Tax=Sordaria brevicollis TaxID=83679 RepID=A0AAE0PHF8_SORBR|nr:hypothetical protein B0T20DRAFT_452063 [Sordaria brevicollis]
MEQPTAKCKNGQLTDFGTMTFPGSNPQIYAGMIQINWKASDRDESATTTTTSAKSSITASNSDSTSGSASASRSSPDLVTITRTVSGSLTTETLDGTAVEKQEDKEEDKPAMGKGAVAGTVVGVMIFILFFPVGWLFRRRKQKKDAAQASPEGGDDSDTGVDPTRSLVGMAGAKPPGSSPAEKSHPAYADYPVHEAPGDTYGGGVYSVTQLDDTKVKAELPIQHEIHEVPAPGATNLPELPHHNAIHEVHVPGAHATPELPTERPAYEVAEPTSTIVLTSPSGRFVDLRILKEDPSSVNHTSIFSTPTSTPPTLGLNRLDWAIAGFSSYTPTRPTIGYYGQKLILPDGRTINGSYADLKSGKQPYTRGRWTHWVDSRISHSSTDDEGGDDAEADEGDMYRVPEDEKLTLERGRMVNPETGREEGYEEVWADGSSGEEGDGDKEKRCVVWEVDVDDEEGKKKRGRVVRVGRWAQGLLRRGNEVVCERWKLGDEGGWRLEVRVEGVVGGGDRSGIVRLLAFPEGMVEMIKVGEEEGGKKKEVGDVVEGWRLVELSC